MLQQKVVLKKRKRIGMQILGRTHLHLDYICKMLPQRYIQREL